MSGPSGAHGTCTTLGTCGHDDVCVRVTFDEQRSPLKKEYSYWAPRAWKLQVGDKVVVIAQGNYKLATVAAVYPSHLCCAKLKRIRVPLDSPSFVLAPPIPAPQPTKENKMIKIENKTFVDGRDITKMTDDDIYDILREAEQEVADLKKIENKPRRLLKRIEDALAGIQSLVNVLNDRDAEQSAYPGEQKESK